MSLHDSTDAALIELIQESLSQRAENPKVEFKDARGGLPQDVRKTISSFSNTPGGGVLVFGVLEDRGTGHIQVVGNLGLVTLQENVTNLFNA